MPTAAVRVGDGVGAPVAGTEWAYRIGFNGPSPPANLWLEDFESEWSEPVNLWLEDFETEWDPVVNLWLEDFESAWE